LAQRDLMVVTRTASPDEAWL